MTRTGGERTILIAMCWLLVGRGTLANLIA
jgi:hypothetical protein